MQSLRWTAGLLMSMFMSTSAPAQSMSVPQVVENIRSAAAALGDFQRRRGAQETTAMVATCYKRHAKATSFDLPLQTCVVQDIILSKVSASVYGGVSEQARKMSGSPDPKTLLNDMTKRVVGVFARLRIPEGDARRFNQLVDQHGFEAFRGAFSKR